ncbi:MAG TPA: winged helix-turn-helix domain-containing protein, partial [Acidimicrobiales bacterium]|nr:winged helix-turn-helix domain-containing protein [Acidimicrobiales bacterium]
MADGLAVALLGPVSVRAADGTETALRGHAAHLLTWLALGDRAWTVDALAERMWPDGPPATARTVIQGVVSRLRRVLGDDGPVRIETVPDGYRLRAVGDDPTRSPVDARRFRALVERAPSDAD